MSCSNPSVPPRSRIGLVLAASASVSCVGLPGVRQAAAFLPPSLHLAYPAPNTPLPAERPLVVIRFRTGDAADPIDPASFAASIDGVDRTASFRASTTDAWTVATPDAAMPLHAPGTHAVTARVCSERGACGAMQAVVTVSAGVAAASLTAPSAPRSGRGLVPLVETLWSIARCAVRCAH